MSKTVSEDIRLSRTTTFTTEPHLRIRRGHTITIRRCYEVARHLWQCGIRTKATKAELENAIFYCVGADHRTANRYIGRWLFSRPVKSQGAIVEPARRIKYVKGYLERLHFAEPCKDGVYLLNFEILPVDVHQGEASGMFISDLCAPVVRCGAHKIVMEGKELAPSYTHIDTTHTHTTHTNQSSESNQKRVAPELSPLEKAILSAEPCEDKDLAKVQWPSQPFKLRFEEPFNPNLVGAKSLRKVPRT